jgi:uncharacterized phiE125 gp8 family phage protein
MTFSDGDAFITPSAASMYRNAAQVPMYPVLLSGPAIEPLSLQEAKSWLRLDSTMEDDLVSALITAARLVVEAATRCLLISQSWRLVLDRWPYGGVLLLPLAPLQSITTIRVYDSNDAAQTLAASGFRVDASPNHARLDFIDMPPSPGRELAGIEIDLEVGYGAQAAEVPEPLRQAMRLLVTRWFENRGDVESDSRGNALPNAVAALLAPYRRVRLA